MSTPQNLLRVENVVSDYLLPRRGLLRPRPKVRALDGVSFTVRPGKSFGIVGESGCGKSTLARIVTALQAPDAGTVHFHDRDLFALPPKELRRMRRHFQMVFQDPYGSLDPRHKVGRIVAEPINGLERNTTPAERRARVAEALADVGLSAADADKFPHEFSGGQRQRIAIARALITRPDLMVADEPVSALDVSVQAQVLNLMMDLQEEHNLAYVFISHDLGVVRHITDVVAVMYLGRIVEEGPTEAVFDDPAHPYTRALIAAVPEPDPKARRRRTIGGEARSPAGEDDGTRDPIGCRFAPRCPDAVNRCREEDPALRTIGATRRAACHFA